MDSARASSLTVLTCAAFHSAAVMAVPVTSPDDFKIFVAHSNKIQWGASVFTGDAETVAPSWFAQEAEFWCSDSAELDALMNEMSDEINSALASNVSLESSADALAWATALVASANR